MTTPTLTPGMLATLVVAAFSAGLVDAIGGGGGLVTVPALLALGLDPRIALATNKGQAVFGAVASAASYKRRGEITQDRVPVAFFAGLLGSLCGALLLTALRPEPLRPVIVVLLLAALGVALVPRDKLPKLSPSRPKLALFAVAFGLGAYDGFFGPGVGSMLLLTNVMLFGDSLVRASGNAKVVNLASNLAAFGLFAAKGTIVFAIALPMAAANATGAYVGAKLAIKGGDRVVRPVVVLVVLAVVAKLLRDLLHR